MPDLPDKEPHEGIKKRSHDETRSPRARCSSPESIALLQRASAGRTLARGNLPQLVWRGQDPYAPPAWHLLRLRTEQLAGTTTVHQAWSFRSSSTQPRAGWPACGPLRPGHGLFRKELRSPELGSYLNWQTGLRGFPCTGHCTRPPSPRCHLVLLLVSCKTPTTRTVVHLPDSTLSTNCSSFSAAPSLHRPHINHPYGRWTWHPTASSPDNTGPSSTRVWPRAIYRLSWPGWP